MIREKFRNQVNLLLAIIPEVGKEKCFALHGGTAINLFLRNMPRLSVDIDLTYVPIEDREVSVRKINEALLRIKSNIESVVPKVSVTHLPLALKLLISTKNAIVKLEVNQIKRGIYGSTFKGILCETAQNEFDIFCTIPIVPIGQVYGGKICAALARQHPRDLFDIKFLLNTEGFSEEIKKGFLFGLLGGNKPFHEIISPNLMNQRSALEKQFMGMTTEQFTYKDFEETRSLLIATIHEKLTEYDKQFLLSIQRLEPDWSIYSFQDFPAVKWRLMNLNTLMENDEKKYKDHYDTLSQLLFQK
ncbi:nucleotidyl transferase AbiEii/AbiGii toxin family protein [Aquiflexum lacus]|uniref:nucleotidyl transferase AbiEii/AbiGii toxin family protein n=1 Tax=Aquiflexum lacus TaxID=2483805 RepID=UPI001893D524|nr:nucleotidyl transferase AbiEii/AbiGii toxin family protein [Aquiflexum lacus]